MPSWMTRCHVPYHLSEVDISCPKAGFGMLVTNVWREKFWCGSTSQSNLARNFSYTRLTNLHPWYLTVLLWCRKMVNIPLWLAGHTIFGRLISNSHYRKHRGHYFALQSRLGQEAPSILWVDVLPFGAVDSVAEFLRVSYALWHIDTVALDLCWTAFYDNSQSYHREKSFCDHLASFCFRLLGIDDVDTGKKAVSSVRTPRCWAWWSTRNLLQLHHYRFLTRKDDVES